MYDRSVKLVLYDTREKAIVSFVVVGCQEEMLGRVTKYQVNNDAPSEVFEADSEQDQLVSTVPPSASSKGWRVLCFSKI